MFWSAGNTGRPTKRAQVLYSVLALLTVALTQTLHAQTEANIVTPAVTVTGSSQVAVGAEVQIYTVEVTDGTAGPLSNTVYLGQNAAGGAITNGGVQILISDLTAPTGLIAADIAELRLYRSADATFDNTDTFIINETTISVDGVTPTTLDLQAQALNANRQLPDAATIFFVVTAVISNSATSGHTFRVGVPVNHLGFHDDRPVVTDLNDVAGGAVAQADGNHIVIAAETPSFSSGVAGGGRGIPFGGEPVMLALLVGTGLYMIRRTSA